MRIFYSAIFLILLFAVSAFAQITTTAPEKPLTQAEYVQLLYTLEKNPSKHDEVVETVRRRGIGFVLTDGLKNLTASKSKSDAELRRTVEEAARRKDNPTASQLPGEKESKDALNKARENTLAAVDDMPDFLVKQVILRSVGYAGTNKFTSTDRLVIAVGYRAAGNEEYRVLSINGIAQADTENKQSYEGLGGSSSTGEFVTILSTIFKPESDTKFEAIDTDVLRGRRSIVYSFETDREKAKLLLKASGHFDSESIAGIKGKIWIDRDSFRVLRVESQATQIPDSFTIRASSQNIDYDWVSINNQKYLLPSLAEFRITGREGKELFENRNEIRFREYRKFDVDIKILDDDVTDENAPVQGNPAQTAPPKKP
jgi:hypothetical protein